MPRPESGASGEGVGKVSFKSINAFLGEQLHANEISGFGVILVGLLLVTGLWQHMARRLPS